MRYKYALTGLGIFVFIGALLLILQPEIQKLFVSPSPTPANQHKKSVSKVSTVSEIRCQGDQMCPPGNIPCPDNGICPSQGGGGGDDGDGGGGGGDDGGGGGGDDGGGGGEDVPPICESGGPPPSIPAGGSANDTIQIKNSTKETMYVFIVKNQANLTGDWKSSSAQTPGNAGNTSYYIVGSGDRLGFNPDSSNIWTSAAVCVTRKFPDDRDGFDYDGLTVFEWTVDEDIYVDVSNTTGTNTKVSLTISGTDKDEISKKCIPDFTGQTKAKYLYKKQGICRYSLKQGGKVGLNTALCKNGPPGDISNCRDCPTGEDKCPSGFQGTWGCVSQNINDRWGCYQWWANPNNEDSQNWLKVFDQCDFYRWP